MLGDVEAVVKEAGAFESYLDGVEEGLDAHLLEEDGERGNPAEDAARIFREFTSRRKQVASLEARILEVKEETRLARNRATVAREKVKMTQAELSCLLLQVHELERERNQILTRHEPCYEERKRRDRLQEELMSLQRKNTTYPPLLSELEAETRRLEGVLHDGHAAESDFIKLLKERCLAKGQELHRRRATEEEWAELNLTIAEHEEEIGKLREEVEGFGEHVAPSVRIERMRWEERQETVEPVNVRVTRHFTIPPGTVRPLVSVQGHGLQGIRSKFNVSIDLELGEGWHNVVAITGTQGDVLAARGEIEKLCNASLAPQKDGLITFPRDPRNRVAPIPTPWARQQRQRHEIERTEQLQEQEHGPRPL